jgi:hypothetical protein
VALGRINLEFPLAGIDRGASHQHQRPFTTQDAQNVRPYDVLENRARGGNRPGLAQAFTEELGSGAYVNLLALVRTANLNPARTFQDHFTDVAAWTNATWDDENLTQSGTILTGPTTNGNRAAVYKTAALDLDWKGDVVISLTINEIELTTYRIFTRMNQSSPNVSSSMGCEVSFEADKLTIRTLKNDSILVSSDRRRVPDPYGDPGILRFTVRANSNFFEVRYFSANAGEYWHDSVIPGFSTGDAIAVEIENDGGAAGGQIDAILVSYIGTGVAPQSQIVAASNGTLYGESGAGALTAITGSLTFGGGGGGRAEADIESTPLSVAARFEKLYIADWAEPRRERLATSDRATIADGTGILIDLDANFITDGVLAGGDVIEITAVVADGTAIATGWYEIDSITNTTTIVLKTLAATPAAPTGEADETAYRIVPGIKIYDSTADTIALMVATAGTAPYGCRIVKLYRDRLVFSGDPNNPGDVFLSKQGDPLGYSYSLAADGVQAAFAFDSGGLGRLGAPVTAIIPVFDDLMMVAGEGECSVLRGDPAVGGTFDHLSRRVGVLSFDAWAPTDDDQIYFLSIDGLYRVNRTELGGLVEPRRVSPDRIPDELREIDTDTRHVFLEYDPEYLGIWIRATSLSSGDSEVWWYDLRLEGFFRDKYAEDHDAFCGVIDDLPNRLVIGCRDGYVRKYSRAAVDDDGTSFTSYAEIGPIRLGRNGRDGYLDDISVALDESGGACTLKVRHGKTPQQAKNAADFSTRTLTAGLNPSFRPRMRGRDAYVRIQNTVAGTVSGTPSKDNGTTTITATADIFVATMVGSTFTFDTSGTSYVIASHTSATVIVVTGDASGETADDTFTITGGRWALEFMEAEVKPGGRLRA